MGKFFQPLAQAADVAAIRRRGLTRDDLVWLRWILLAGQAVALVAASRVPGFAIPLLPCLALVGLGAMLNLSIGLVATPKRPTTDGEASLHLAFDLMQMSGLLFLTGGVSNPFSLLLIAPPTLAAATLPFRHAIGLAGLAVVCAVTLAFLRLSEPWAAGLSGEPALASRLSSAVAVVFGVVFFASYAWRASREAARMGLALDMTQAVLAREQRLSALGGLAAAAAHELGTPLATISIVSKEMARSATGDLAEDARLLQSQAERCRDILRRLTDDPETVDEMHARMSLTQAVHEILSPHAEGPVRVEALVKGAPDVPAPDLRRIPEMLHAMTSFVDNAVDFARSEVLVTARYDAEHLALEVRDDGPGFSTDVIARLGQPYVTSRPSPEATTSGHSGMGLGFFIAKTLLERTGAAVGFDNAPEGGARVIARWPRNAIELPPIP